MSAATVAEVRIRAESAAARAGVEIAELTNPEQAGAAADLLDQIWNKGGDGPPPVIPGLLIALEHAGNYCAGAYLDRQLVGVTVGFFGPPDQAMMHSHIAGVLAGAAGRGIGEAMKLHQAHWCLERGVSTLEWTFDPLILRNASFNLNRLGVTLEEYLPEFYGEMLDGVNLGQGSDRALVRWRPATLPAGGVPSVPSASGAEGGGVGEAGREVELCLSVGADGEPLTTVVPDGGTVGLQIPSDIEAIRVVDPALSARWRVALRETMAPLLGTGWNVRGIRRDGTYLLHR